jgi:ferredoxin
MKKLRVDKKKCIGCGSCAAIAPKSFKMDEDGKSEALDPAGDDEETIANAIDCCPVDAIEWEEKGN